MGLGLRERKRCLLFRLVVPSNWCKLVGDFLIRLGDVLLLGLFSALL